MHDYEGNVKKQSSQQEDTEMIAFISMDASSNMFNERK